MIYIGINGAWVPITNMYIGVSGAWKQITGAWIGVSGSWKNLLASPLSASVVPTSISASTISPSKPRISITTSSASVTVSGGSGSYSHSWTIAFNPAGSIDVSGTCSVTSPSAATTSFAGQVCSSVVAPGTDNYTATDTITDTVTGAQTTITVPIALTNNYIGP